MARSLALAAATTGLLLAAPLAHADAKDKKADPPGNNGTVKIGAVPLDKAPHANQPHVGCTFSLRFFGFDAGQTADITFTGQAPTKAGVLLTQKAVTVSNDAAGGGRDADAVLTYTAAQLGLDEVQPSKNGWHVKVAVDVREAPGGAKQKVFWLSCPQAAPVGSGSTAAPPPKSTPRTTPPATTPTTPRSLPRTAPAPATGGTAAAPFTGGGGSVSAAQAPAAAAVGAAAAESAPARSLPRTGLSASELAGVAAWLLAFGTLLTQVGRRRHERAIS